MGVTPTGAGKRRGGGGGGGVGGGGSISGGQLACGRGAANICPTRRSADVAQPLMDSGPVTAVSRRSPWIGRTDRRSRNGCWRRESSEGGESVSERACRLR